ncbi:chromatin binding protein, partial [Coelomomyces lativittatus]
WHPTLPYCVSVSHYGTIVVWNTFTQEKWSAYAPGFQEIEENVEYIEREDEFDRDSSPPTSPSLQPTSGYLDFHSTSLIDLESDEEMFWVTVNLEEQRTDIPKQPALLHQVHGQNEHEPKKRKRNMV